MNKSIFFGGRRRLASVFVGLALFAGAAFAQGKPVAPSGAKPDEYQIGAHDLLELSVFQVPEMSRTVRVNSRGQISLPLIGAVDAGGLTAEELEAVLVTKLADGHLQEPQVSVFIKEFISQRVIIEGSVMKAGVYPLTGRTTLLQAIAMASGVDPIANESEVKVFRQSRDGVRETIVYDLDAIRTGKSDDPQIKGNDLVVVEKSATRSMVKTVADTVRGILLLGR